MRIRSILILVSCAVLATPASAHPLDISATTATVKTDGVSLVTFLHSYEAELLMNRAGVLLSWSDTYTTRATVITEYLHERVSVSVAGSACPLSDPIIPEQAMYEILSKGLEIRSSAACQVTPRDTVEFRIDLFPDLPLQTNRLTVYDLRSANSPVSPRVSYVLTPKIPVRAYDPGVAMVSKPDTDRDGLPDEEERIYRTDPNNPDTDGDNYSDYEEATLGWNAVNPTLGPGQTPRGEFEPFELSQVLFESGAVASTDTDAKYRERYVRSTDLSDSSGWGQQYLVEVLKSLDAIANEFSWKDVSTVILGVALLGFLHALGPGHAKWLLAALVADKRRSYAEWVIFAGIFTITHLIDIVLLFAVTRGIFAIADPTAYMAYLQMGATILLLCVGAWLGISSWRRLGRPMDTNPPPSMRVGFLTGLIAGIAPCTFGWSLFLLLFSLGRLDMVPWVLAAFGTGIFACLWLIATSLYFFRERTYRGIDVMGHWSPLVSGFLVFGIGLWLAAGYIA